MLLPGPSRRLLSILLLFAMSGAAAAAPLPRLKVSENKRFLVTEDNKPFFWLGDTAWELFHRLTREEAERYLKNRAEKRFTVVQAVALAEFDGLTAPNAYGHLPLRNNDPAQPVEEYFAHVDWVIARANALGLYVGLLPSWGDKWNRKWGAGPEVFTPANARTYGEWLGRRYRNADIIWILGGDRPIETEAHRAIIRAMAAGRRWRSNGRAASRRTRPDGPRRSARRPTPASRVCGRSRRGSGRTGRCTPPGGRSGAC